MKRFVVAAVAAVAVSLGVAGTADAQYVQRSVFVTPGGGVVVNNGFSTWGAQQFNRTYVSPFGYQQQSFYGDVFGNSVGRSYGYNNFTGFGYNRGFYQPSPFVSPFGGYRYNVYGRPFGW